MKSSYVRRLTNTLVFHLISNTACITLYKAYVQYVDVIWPV
jgi:hypothetical protein